MKAFIQFLDENQQQMHCPMCKKPLDTLTEWTRPANAEFGVMCRGCIRDLNMMRFGREGFLG